MSQENKEKITDQALNRFVVCSVLSIVFCLVCLCSTTFAWFTDSQTNAKNEIKSASECLLEVVVEDANGTALSDIEEGVLLVGGETYTVTLTLPKDSASGYCKILVGEDTYYSECIRRHSDDVAHTVTFELKPTTSATASFITRWGVYSAECSVVNGELVLP